MIVKSVKTRSYDFALKIINTYCKLPKAQQDFLLSKQLLKSGTSIGARLQMVSDKDPKKDLFVQLNLSKKETLETSYLLRLMNDIGYLPEGEFANLFAECNELSTTLQSMIGKLKKFPF
ncbi:MAG: four helix bundle protein [Cyclobacteriaceae bacterium]